MSITVRPNSVLHQGEGMLALIVTALIGIGIAVGFSKIGAWPVTPFVLAALAGLAMAVFLVSRHVDDFERIVIKDDWLTVDRHAPTGDEHFEFNGYWVQVVHRTSIEGGCAYLALRSNGRDLVVGRHLTDEERAEVSCALRSRLAKLRQ